MQRMAGELIFDYALYPRTAVSQLRVTELIQAREAGAQFPPVIVDQNGRVIDGFHRTSAILRREGAEAPIEIEERQYATEGEAFLDAVRLNTAHGTNLTQYDRVRVVTLARALQVDEDAIAASLHLTPTRLEKLAARRLAQNAAGEPVPLKACVTHLRGRPITENQQQAIKRSAGWSLIFHLNQIMNLIDGDLVEPLSEPVVQKMTAVRDLLTEFLASNATE